MMPRAGVCFFAMATSFASFGAFRMSNRVASLSPNNRGLASGRSRMRSLVVDTDMGFDDVFAMLLLTRASKRSAYNLQLISTVSGMNTASIGAKVSRNLFPSAIVTAGKDETDYKSGIEYSWLPEYRERFRQFASNKMGSKFDGGTSSIDALVKVLGASEDSECDLMCLGPLTNVATWLQDPDLAKLMNKKLGVVYILGGNHPKYNSDGEFNFMEDPSAASAVIESPHLAGKLRIVTSSVSGSKSEGLSRGLVESVRAALSTGTNDPRMVEVFNMESDAVYYDPVCAFAYAHSNDLPFEEMNVRVEDGILEQCDDAHSSVTLLDHLNETHRQNYVDWVQSCARVSPPSETPTLNWSF